jgi:hypothetical protein
MKLFAERCRFATAKRFLIRTLPIVLIVSVHAWASLGGEVASVASDQQQMKATKRTVQKKANYSIHEITTPYGTVVREYVSPAGKVFGVAWRGPFLPNFQQILGDSYPQFVEGAREARTAQPRRAGNAPLVVSQPNFVMHSVGRMRAYAGQAYLPGMIPQGVDSQAIQ